VAKSFKDPVQRFSQQVVLNKCFFLNPEKFLVQIRSVVSKKSVKTAYLRRTPNAQK